MTNDTKEHDYIAQELGNIDSAQLDELENKILDQLIEKARDHFHTFVQLMAPVVLPEEFTDGRHIEIICDKLQEVQESVEKRKGAKRLQLFLPPGSMKSKLASNLFPAWCLGRHANWCFLAIGADADFAVDNFGRPTKDIIDSDRYQAIFPNTVLKKDVQAAGRWDTTKKGRFVAKGAGQGIAGRRAHISICDDVINEQTLPAEVKKINGWYRKGLRTRLLPQGAEIIINTRWFVEDLSGFMLKVDRDSDRPWEVIEMPALLTQEASTMLRKGLPSTDTRFAVDTSFWPEFWPTETLQSIKATTPSSEWAALYMQRPVSDEGGIVKKSEFKLWDNASPPPCKYIVASMDTAYSLKEAADYTAYSIWGIFNRIDKSFDNSEISTDCMILLSAGKGKWDFAELCKKTQEVNNKYTPDFFIIEDKAAGISLIPEMRKRGIPIMAYSPDRDKMSRLQACTPYFQTNRIWIPQNREWADELVEEVISFPKAPHDDYVDTVTQAVLWMRDNFKIDNDGYSNHNDDEDEFWQKKRKTYWSALTSKG